MAKTMDERVHKMLTPFFVLLCSPWISQGKGTETCRSVSRGHEVVNAFVGESVNLSCTFSMDTRCGNGIWTSRHSDSLEWLIPGQSPVGTAPISVYYNDTYGSGSTTLSIKNASADVAGTYGCYCQTLSTSHLVNCFQLILKIPRPCMMELKRNNRGIERYDHQSKAGQTKKEEVVHVTFNDTMAVKCSREGATLKSNCSDNHGTAILLTADKSIDDCRIVCKVQKTCKTRIFLKVARNQSLSKNSTTLHSSQTTSTSPLQSFGIQVNLEKNGHSDERKFLTRVAVFLIVLVVILLTVALLLLHKVIKERPKSPRNEKRCLTPLHHLQFRRLSSLFEKQVGNGGTGKKAVSNPV